VLKSIYLVTACSTGNLADSVALAIRFFLLHTSSYFTPHTLCLILYPCCKISKLGVPQESNSIAQYGIRACTMDLIWIWLSGLDNYF